MNGNDSLEARHGAVFRAVPLARLAGEDVRENRFAEELATERACERPAYFSLLYSTLPSKPCPRRVSVCLS